MSSLLAILLLMSVTLFPAADVSAVGETIDTEEITDANEGELEVDKETTSAQPEPTPLEPPKLIEETKPIEEELAEAKECAAKVTDLVTMYAKTPKEIISSAQAADNTAVEETAAKITSLVTQGLSKGA